MQLLLVGLDSHSAEIFRKHLPESILVDCAANRNEAINKCGAKDYQFAVMGSKLLRALLARPERLKVGPLRLDTQKQVVTKAGEEIVLNRKEFRLLELLMRNRGKVLSRKEILEEVWDFNANLFTNTVETHIATLRRKIDSKEEKLIRTVCGRGYKLVEPV